MELDTGDLFNALLLLLLTGVAGYLRAMFKKTEENRERIIKLEERAKRHRSKDEENEDDNGHGYLD